MLEIHPSTKSIYATKYDTYTSGSKYASDNTTLL
jgi:hypothetical protein